MSVQVEHIPEGDYVEMRYVGVIPPRDLLDTARLAISLAHAHHTSRILADCTKMTAGHTIVDLYGLFDLLQAEFPTWSYREALIMPRLEASVRDVQFWETGCRNRGFDVRVFPDRPSALAWLCESKTPDGASALLEERGGGQP